jgi:nicotinamidase-related amidase
MELFLKKESCGLWIVDVQEKLFPLVDRCDDVLEKIIFTLMAAKLLKLPIFVTEQHPQGLGETLAQIKKQLPQGEIIYPKTTFSGYKDPEVKKAVDQIGVQTWILVGIEAHICVLQTAKDLLTAQIQVVALNDAISARSLFDFSSAIGEMRDVGVRISSSETVIYELIRDAQNPEFKAILPLVKQHA